MAIAGLHNVSVLESSFLRDSQAQPPQQISEEGTRVSTRASSILQMWRELEDEHVVSRGHGRVRERERLFQPRDDGSIADFSRSDTFGSRASERSGDSEDASVGEHDCSVWSEGQTGSQNDPDVFSTYNSENSSDFGEVERGRVRQIFREWMASGGGECTSNISHNNNSSRAEWHGETEQERARVMREWVQINSQRRGTCGGGRENQPAEFGSQVEQVRDGPLNQNEGQNQLLRRGIRRLCGRQALLDMVKRAEMERKLELQGLMEYRAVTNFPHRNRIQSLLRGWFLRHGRSVENKKPSSVAESELGLLRQRSTVSGLREGFFSRCNSVCGQASSSLSDTCKDDNNSNGDEQAQGNNSYEVINDFCEQSELSSEGSDDQEHDSHRISDARVESGDNAVEDIDSRESNVHVVEGWREQVPDNVVRDWQRSTSVEFVERRDRGEQNFDTDLQENTDSNSQDNTANEWARNTLQVSAGERTRDIQEAGDIANHQSEPSREPNEFPGLSGVMHNSEGNTDTVDDVNRPESTSENEERDWEPDVAEFTEWRESPVENTVENQQQTTEVGWSMGNEDRENSQLEEAPEEWHGEGGFQEAVQSWLVGPSDHEAVPAGRVDTYYFPDDDNVYGMELRELLSRRRVSNLLHSGFRESLDQLIQSYVERQGHAAMDWELHGSHSPGSVEQDLEQASANQSETQGDDVVRSSVALPSQPLPSPPIWEQESHHDNWTQHDMHQRLGIEWEIINDMRIDMARLQQRMNNLQRMMETCMDMQLELQRSIRQEVSAALNRTSGCQGVCEVGLPSDDSKWDHVRKGICCICCDSNIDSLLYRCGHMCTCAKCATELVESRGKCPMCRAPVIEVIRAYSIL
ncbi:Protein neuralized [Morus notabilis]|uniref:Protein neuralized n=1 Tax=Morus notabilis TaxID=981085 RepID=W9SSP9_9ROSA|nr:uncharacterized protein LOC21395008 [Morus notabilis]EXC24902.1 Protein neuralized [Morus notabilis]